MIYCFYKQVATVHTTSGKSRASGPKPHPPPNLPSSLEERTKCYDFLVFSLFIWITSLNSAIWRLQEGKIQYFKYSIYAQ